MRELTFGGSRRNSNISDNLPATRNLQPAKIKHCQRNVLNSFSTAWYPPLWPSNERSFLMSGRLKTVPEKTFWGRHNPLERLLWTSWETLLSPFLLLLSLLLLLLLVVVVVLL